MILVPSANHRAVIAGQGTIGLEIVEQLRELGVVDAIHRARARRAGRAGGRRSDGGQVDRARLARVRRRTGARRRHARLARSGRADAVAVRATPRGRSPTACAARRRRRSRSLTCRRTDLDGVITVSEDEIVDAMAVAAREARLVLEPSGAVSLAALLFHRDELPAGPVVAVLSGGNVDPARFVEWLARADLIRSTAARLYHRWRGSARPAIHAARGHAHRRPRKRARRQARCAVPATCCPPAARAPRRSTSSTPSRSCSCPRHRPVSTRTCSPVDGTVSADDPAELIALVVRERRAMTADGAQAARAFAGPERLTGRPRGTAAGRLRRSRAARTPKACSWQPSTDEAPDPNNPENPITALADLCAVAIRQARLESALLERADWIGRLANTDSLTGLANKVTFERMLELEIARATRQETLLSVLLFDIDGFAEINDRAGAATGDEVLRHVAATLADQVRLVDTVARYGPRRVRADRPGRWRRDRRTSGARCDRQARGGRRANQHQRRRGGLSGRRRAAARSCFPRPAARWPRPSDAVAARSSPPAEPKPERRAGRR